MGRYLGSMALCLLCACSPDVDGPPTTDPEIVKVEFVTRSGDDGEIFTFRLDFSDYDGNLGQGSLSIAVNEEEPKVFELEMLFGAQTFPVALDAKLGQIEFDITHQPMSIDRGDMINFKFILTDGAQESSMPEQLTLVAVIRGGG